MNKFYGAGQELLPSLLDRLLGDDSDLQQESSNVYRQHAVGIEKSIKRDLENLLNTRRRCESWPTELQELDYSLVNYGLPDFLAMNLAFEEGRQVFRRMIERTIQCCEPRLFDVRVTVLDDVEPINRTLQFRIHAKLRAEPTPETITFDSSLEPVSCNIRLNFSNHE